MVLMRSAINRLVAYSSELPLQAAAKHQTLVQITVEQLVAVLIFEPEVCQSVEPGADGPRRDQGSRRSFRSIARAISTRELTASRCTFAGSGPTGSPSR